MSRETNSSAPNNPTPGDDLFSPGGVTSTPFTVTEQALEGPPDDEFDRYLSRVESGIRVRKVVSTRSIKGPHGESFVGFSSEWDSTQLDGDRGMLGLGDVDSDAEQASVMTLSESMTASHILAQRATEAALKHAYADGAFSASTLKNALASVRARYAQIHRSEFNKSRREEK